MFTDELFNSLRSYSTFTMIKKTQYSCVSLAEHNGVPVAVKRYHDVSRKQNYIMERDVLLLLQGSFRTPRLLGCDDEQQTLLIEWIAGDRLKEYCIKKYLHVDDVASFGNAAIIQDAHAAFKGDQSGEAQRIKYTICALVYLLHLHGIVHGDVEFRNVVRTPQGRIYLIDFSNAALYKNSPAVFENDYRALERHFGIDWYAFEKIHSAHLQQKYAQCFPEGLLAERNGHGFSERAFDFLDIHDGVEAHVL